MNQGRGHHPSFLICMSKKVALHTLGCKLNFSETSTIGEQFRKKGFNIVNFDSEADIYVINTCTVTENAERECRQIVRRALRNNPDAYIAVTGCYAQLRPEEIASIPGVDAVLGSSEKFRLLELLENFEKQELACVFVSPTESMNSDFGLATSTDADSRTRAFFKIQDGCDYKCSFCTIPLARGKSRSLDLSSAVWQFQNLLERGYKEIILTGVNVGDYSSEKGEGLYELLKAFLEVDGEYRLRISSIEPNLLNDNIIELTANDPRMCKHFHIPLQSGSDKILRLMQRRYNSELYSERIRTIKNRIPDCCIGVDVIVGFPGESESDFLDTHQFLRDLPISYLHVFTYSERPETKAITFPASVDMFERRRRNNILRILSEKKKNEFLTSMIGKNVQVLFESEEKNGEMRGFSSNYIRASHSYQRDSVNNFTVFQISSIIDNIAYGNIIN